MQTVRKDTQNKTHKLQKRITLMNVYINVWDFAVCISETAYKKLLQCVCLCVCVFRGVLFGVVDIQIYEYQCVCITYLCLNREAWVNFDEAKLGKRGESNKYSESVYVSMYSLLYS